MKQTLDEEVNTPRHYRTHESGLEAIEITRHLLGDLSNAWKYAMRYEDKGTPKKDIKKLCWYLNDFRENFIDDDNMCVANVGVPDKVKDMMFRVMESEPVEQIRSAFNQIYLVVREGGVVSPDGYQNTIEELEKYSNTLS